MKRLACVLALAFAALAVLAAPALASSRKPRATPAPLAPQLSVARVVSNLASNGAVFQLTNGAQLSLPSAALDRPINIALNFFNTGSSSSQPFDETGNAIPPPLNPQVRLTRTAGMPFWYQTLPTDTTFRQPAELDIPIPADLSVVDAVTGLTRAVTDGEKSSQLKIVFFDGMEWVTVGGRFTGLGSGPDPSQTYITAQVNHLSTFALALDQTPAVFIGGPLLSGIALNNTTFTPNGDGINDTTTLSYSLAEPATVTVRVYDNSGELITTVVQDVQVGGGANSVQWDGSYQFASRKVPAGIYIMEIKALTLTSSRADRQTILVGVMK